MATKNLGIHQSTYDAVFQHPVSHNVQRRDVKSMLGSLAEMTEETNGNLKFTRNGQTLTMHPSQHKDFPEIEELMKIRHFIERSSLSEQPTTAGSGHLLVVIDHREARIYKTELHGTVPQRIKPIDPTDSHRHLHSVDNNDNGTLKPEMKQFYEAVARSLIGALQIVIFGEATGASSAMEHLMAVLNKSHHELAKRVIGTVVVNEKHMSEDQLLAKARAFYASKHV